MMTGQFDGCVGCVGWGKIAGLAAVDDVVGVVGPLIVRT